MRVDFISSFFKSFSHEECAGWIKFCWLIVLGCTFLTLFYPNYSSYIYLECAIVIIHLFLLALFIYGIFYYRILNKPFIFDSLYGQKIPAPKPMSPFKVPGCSGGGEKFIENKNPVTDESE